MQTSKQNIYGNWTVWLGADLPRATLCETSPVSRGKDTGCPQPTGSTLAEWHHPCCQRGGLQLPETEQGRVGFHPGPALCPFGDAVASFWGRTQLTAEPPCPALLLPEQLSSLACKGNKTAALLWVQTRGPQSHTGDTQIPVHLSPP